MLNPDHIKIYGLTLILCVLFNLSNNQLFANIQDSSFLKKGIVKYNKGIFPSSLEDLNKAIHNEPHNFEAYYYRALVQFELSNYESAIHDLNKTIELKPTYSMAFMKRGQIRAAQKDKKGAIEDYSQAITLDPNN
ncbi:MAG: tetratricopeptide repeat protein, partial [Cytophagales bacterium]